MEGTKKKKVRPVPGRFPLGKVNEKYVLIPGPFQPTLGSLPGKKKKKDFRKGEEVRAAATIGRRSLRTRDISPLAQGGNDLLPPPMPLPKRKIKKKKLDVSHLHVLKKKRKKKGSTPLPIKDISKPGRLQDKEENTSNFAARKCMSSGPTKARHSDSRNRLGIRATP